MSLQLLLSFTRSATATAPMAATKLGYSRRYETQRSGLQYQNEPATGLKVVRGMQKGTDRISRPFWATSSGGSDGGSSRVTRGGGTGGDRRRGKELVFDTMIVGSPQWTGSWQSEARIWWSDGVTYHLANDLIADRIEGFAYRCVHEGMYSDGQSRIGPARLDGR